MEINGLMNEHTICACSAMYVREVESRKQTELNVHTSQCNLLRSK